MAYVQSNHLPTMFGEIRDKNVTFLIDTSGSMYSYLDAVKDHLIETLSDRAQSRHDTMFNIIEFNSEITQWADKMVKCTPQTVSVATGWIRNLAPKTGTNTQDALLTAFSDAGCESVFLLTDGLPDQHPTDILDHVGYSAQGRSVHCIYLTGDSADSAATEFLQDLAMETHGSFHIVTITQHGVVERITPVFCADHSYDRVRTTDDRMVLKNEKVCSVTTSLRNPPDEIHLVSPAPGVFLTSNTIVPISPVPMSHYAWSRYRPARSWIKRQENLAFDGDTSCSPAAGVLLIGQRVLARRMADGLFYLGSVKTQVMADKFLIEFGPCKHGKYKDTEYQETFVYDIITYADGLRHSVLPGDKVLAPWEPEGERFGPGTVIDGSERRFAEGPDNDNMITVTFYHGRTTNVPRGIAVWIPSPLFERIALEINMPLTVRKTMESQDNYPEENFPGYPTSGPNKDPIEFNTVDPLFSEQALPSMSYGGGVIYHPRPGYAPVYPSYYKHNEKPCAVRSEEMNMSVPGTGMTRDQLNDKVVSQIMQHKMAIRADRTVMSEKRKLQEEKYKLFHQKRELEMREKLLNKREMLNHDSMLRRYDSAPEFKRRSSVEFNDKVEYLGAHSDGSEPDLDLYDLEGKDSGLGTYASNSFDYLDDNYFSDTENNGFHTRLTSSQRRPRSAYSRSRQRSRTRSPNRHRNCHHSPIRSVSPSNLKFRYSGATPVRDRPDWKYSSSEKIPETIAPNTPGPFRETALQAPLEAREQRVGPNGYVEWGASSFGYVDSMAKHKYDLERFQEMDAKEKLLMTPHPPPARDNPEMIEERGRDFRRNKVIERNNAHETRVNNSERMKLVMQDNHRERVSAQIESERQRQIQAQDQIQRTRDAKAKISAELRNQMESRRAREQNMQEHRLDGMRQRQAVRGTELANKMHLEEQQAAQQQAMKLERAQSRFNEVHNNLKAEEYTDAVRDAQRRNANMQRVRHFQKLETDAQAQKDLRIGVTDQKLAMLRSQIII